MNCYFKEQDDLLKPGPGEILLLKGTGSLFINKIFKELLLLIPPYNETPRFHGMKSSWPLATDFAGTSPLATLITCSRIRAPASSMVS